MGLSNSKIEKSEALRLCRERKRFIKQAIDSRYELSVTHLSYIQSLRNIGIALRRFAEAEVLIDCSDKTPTSNCSNPSPSHTIETLDSPLNNGSSLSLSHSTVSYMKSGGGSQTMTVKINPSSMEDESLTFHSPHTPPPDTGSSWDFFDAIDDAPSFRFLSENGFDHNCETSNNSKQFVEETSKDCEKVVSKENREIVLESVRSESEADYQCKGSHGLTISKRLDDVERIPIGEGIQMKPGHSNGLIETLRESSLEKAIVKKDSCEEREEPSEFMTHKAKDFLSSIKDIENRFFSASESGKEVSRMLETNKVRSRCVDARGTSTSVLSAAFQLACCHRELEYREPPEQLTKEITCDQSISSLSTSSKNPLAPTSKDDGDDSGSDFIEEFSMITGSHSSTLDRLFAWERKLYDEVKASESIRKEYDQKCDQLRHQFARDASAQVIDKTRAIVKDLHSRIRVGLHAVDSIAKRIEKLRDEELQPQLVELIQGFVRMWKSMLNCHHAQYITISLAYHPKVSTNSTNGESYRQILTHLELEIDCFTSSFANWIDAHKSYMEAINGWLQNCILLPRERLKGRRVFSPRRALAPPIFVLCRDWSLGVRSLPSSDVVDSFKDLVSILHQVDEQQKKQRPSNLDSNEEIESGEDGKSEKTSNLICLQTSLTQALHRLTKFTEASLKMCEDTRQASETARVAYSNCRALKY